jgi:hypothetical protein
MESLRTEAHNCSCLLLLFKILNNKTNKPQNALKKKRISIQPSHRTFFSSTRTIPPHVNVCTKTTAHRVERSNEGTTVKETERRLGNVMHKKKK